ncbi:MAG: diguanylate cyclase [Bifidobacterium adolescentis]
MMDVSCITTAWVVLGDAQSPFWAVYLYTLVGYGRRYVGARYAVLAGYIVVNILLARAIIAGGPLNSGIFDSNLLTMMVLALAVASLSHAIGSAWRNAEHRARRLAETDSLTGIANRRVFLEQLDALAAEPSAGFALLMLDLDDFKRLNDEHGHLYGDRVLAQVARDPGRRRRGAGTGRAVRRRGVRRHDARGIPRGRGGRCGTPPSRRYGPGANDDLGGLRAPASRRTAECTSFIAYRPGRDINQLRVLDVQVLRTLQDLDDPGTHLVRCKARWWTGIDIQRSGS